MSKIFFLKSTLKIGGGIFYSNLSYDPLFRLSVFFGGVFLGFFGFVFEFSKSFLESTQKVRLGLISSFWSYEPPFRQEGGEGEAVIDGCTDGQTNGIFHS